VQCAVCVAQAWIGMAMIAAQHFVFGITLLAGDAGDFC
jgi:hypothetical protein